MSVRYPRVTLRTGDSDVSLTGMRYNGDRPRRKQNETFRPIRT
ncbi:hypothetical protein [Bhargavaea changchunensis]